MKRIPALFVSVLVLIPATAFPKGANPIETGCKNWVKMFGKYHQSGESSGTVSEGVVPDANVDFAVKGRVLYVNGNRLSSPWELQEVIRAMGRYDRVSKLANTIYTYDSKGVLVYEAPDSGRVSEINVSFIIDKYDFSAQAGFTGAFSVDNFRYSGKSTIDEVKKNLASYKIEKAYGDSYRVSTDGIYLYFNYDPATGRLTSVSFGTEK